MHNYNPQLILLATLPDSSDNVSDIQKWIKSTYLDWTIFCRETSKPAWKIKHKNMIY